MSFAKPVSESVTVAVTVIMLLVGCGGPDHIGAHAERRRRYEPGEYPEAAATMSEGSIISVNYRGIMADFRANAIGDLVTIRIDENPEAAGAAGTSMDRNSSRSMNANIPMFGIMNALRSTFPTGTPEADVNTGMTELFSLLSGRNFDADGNTARSSRVQADIAVRVKQVMPNGDLFVEGTKIMMVNEEELHIYISGLVRPSDIEHDNSVSSSLVADAQIEFTGAGPLDQNQEQGWLSRLLNIVEPL